MLDLILLLVFSVMSYRIAAAILREAAVLREFNQPKTLAPVVLLFPFGPLLLLVGPLVIPGPVPMVAAFACYVPALVLARRQFRALEKAGTDRVRAAQSAITEAFGTAIAGLIYVAVVSLFVFGFVAVGRHA